METAVVFGEYLSGVKLEAMPIYGTVESVFSFNAFLDLFCTLKCTKMLYS